MVLFVLLSVSVYFSMSLFCPVRGCQFAESGPSFEGFKRRNNGLTSHVASHLANGEITAAELAKVDYQICKCCLVGVVTPKYFKRGVMSLLAFLKER